MLALLLVGLAILAQAKDVLFEITLTWNTSSPDGYAREAILVNDLIPGPPLYVDQGDQIYFIVWNLMPFNTTIHFHGIEQVNTPWSDGVPGLAQRPIQPGAGFLYEWNANEYGSYFYHCHAQGQIDDGCYGAIHVRASEEVARPFGLITNDSQEMAAITQAEKSSSPIILSDWTHLTSTQRWKAEVAAGRDSPCTNSILINGKGSAVCLNQAEINSSMTPRMWTVTGGVPYTDMACLPPQLAVGQGDFPHNLSAAPQGLWFGCQASTGSAEVLNVDAKTQYVSYDVISAAGTSTFIFSIDEHPVWVYAVDGRYVTPTLVDAFTISNGQRFSILVKLDKPPALYNIRTVVSGLNQIMEATSYLSYAGRLKPNSSSQPYITLNGTGLTSETVFWEEAAAIPFPPVAPSLTSDETYILPIARYKASYNWTLGSTQYPTFQAGGEEPLLFNLNAQGSSSPWEIRTQNGSWVDLVIVTEGVASPHPIHKHSNKYFVIGKGTGPWNYSSVADAIAAQPSSFNLVNPPMRDTYSTPEAAGDGSWLVLRYQVVNPGAFLLHCHIQSHLDGGMAINLLDGINKWPAVPASYLHSNGF